MGVRGGLGGIERGGGEWLTGEGREWAWWRFCSCNTERDFVDDILLTIFMYHLIDLSALHGDDNDF